MSTYDYETTYETAEMIGNTTGAIVGGFLILGIIFIIIALVFSIISIIGQWKTFKKAGKGGWEAIIPIYNTFVLCQITGVNPWWILIIFAGNFVLGLLSAIPVVGVIFTLASYALMIYFFVLLYVSTARSFGKSDGYAAGLYFLAPIFWLLLGGKNTQYLGAKPMDDVVMNFVNEKILNKGPQTNVNQQAYAQQPYAQQPFAQPQQPMNTAPVSGPVAEKFCTNCGYKVTNGERFCPGCGNEIL